METEYETRTVTVQVDFQVAKCDGCGRKECGEVKLITEGGRVTVIPMAARPDGWVSLWSRPKEGNDKNVGWLCPICFGSLAPSAK